MNDIILSNENIVGIVLIGGQSSRMGQDKASLEIKNLPLYKIAAQTLLRFCHQVHLSVNKSQHTENTYEYPSIVDQYEAQGPIGALLSCMQAIEDAPLLILACDMPFITDSEIAQLLQHRNHNQICTTFYNTTSHYYEPMLSIWEPRGKHTLQAYFEAGNLSLQKFLLQQNIPKINIPEESNFSNINHPEEWNMIM